MAVRPAFATAADLPCGTAIPIPIAVEPFASLARIASLNFAASVRFPTFEWSSMSLSIAPFWSAATAFNSMPSFFSKSVIFIDPPFGYVPKLYPLYKTFLLKVTIKLHYCLTCGEIVREGCC